MFPTVHLTTKYQPTVLNFLLTITYCRMYEGKSISRLQNVIEKETNGDNDIQTTFIFQRNLPQKTLNTCPTLSQVPGNLRREILAVAV